MDLVALQQLVESFRAGIERVSPALADGFLIAVLPGRSKSFVSEVIFCLVVLLSRTISHTHTHCWVWDIEVPNCYCRTVHSSLPFCQYLLHIFWWSVIRYINVYNCYIVLLYWTFYWYVMSLSPVTFLIWSILCDISLATPASFWLLLAWNSIFHPLPSNLFVSLDIK